MENRSIIFETGLWILYYVRASDFKYHFAWLISNQFCDVKRLSKEIPHWFVSVLCVVFIATSTPLLFPCLCLTIKWEDEKKFQMKYKSTISYKNFELKKKTENWKILCNPFNKQIHVLASTELNSHVSIMGFILLSMTIHMLCCRNINVVDYWVLTRLY